MLDPIVEDGCAISNLAGKLETLPHVIAGIRRAVQKQRADGCMECSLPFPGVGETDRLAAINGASCPPIHRKSSHGRLPRIIEAIKTALCRQVEQSDVPQFKQLLNALLGAGVPLAALSVCGRGTREIRYTQLLGYFLDPRQSHGLQERILRALLGPELLRLKRKVPEASWTQAVVCTERFLGTYHGKRDVGCTVDLWIEVHDLIILIEHKINSAESGTVSAGEASQLKRYSLTATSNPERGSRQLVKIYLTPDGRAPKEDTSWIAMSHRTLVKRLEDLLSSCDLSLVARFNLCALLWDLISGPLAVDGILRTRLVEKLKESQKGSVGAIRVRRWLTVNVPMFETLIRIVRVCHGEADD